MNWSIWDLTNKSKRYISSVQELNEDSQVLLVNLDKK